MTHGMELHVVRVTKPAHPVVAHTGAVVAVQALPGLRPEMVRGLHPLRGALAGVALLALLILWRAAPRESEYLEAWFYCPSGSVHMVWWSADAYPPSAADEEQWCANEEKLLNLPER